MSFDDGEHWQSLRLNMPATSIRDLIVKDDDLILRQNSALSLSGRTHCQVGEEERVVDDQKVGRRHALASLVEEAFAEGRALLAEAISLLGTDAIPHAQLRHLRQRRERSVGRVLRPFLDLPERFELAIVVEQIILPPTCLLQPPLA